MKKIKEWIKTKQVQYILFALAGLLIGWLLFSPSSTVPQADSGHPINKPASANNMY